MPSDFESNHRRSIRLKRFDYAKVAAYFVTVCLQNQECLFGKIEDGVMHLNDAGRMVLTAWDALPDRFQNIKLDVFSVMPNHIHGILFLTRRGDPCDRPPSEDRGKAEHQNRIQGDHKDRPYGTLPGTVGRMVQAYKSITTVEYGKGVKQSGLPAFSGKLWQRNYWERVIRDDTELNRIQEYIVSNPARWELDKLNLKNKANSEKNSNLILEPWMI
jgi:REP element-mobilizing transposase RayT